MRRIAKIVDEITNANTFLLLSIFSPPKTSLILNKRFIL